jgi:hypothetical protein
MALKEMHKWGSALELSPDAQTWLAAGRTKDVPSLADFLFQRAKEP